ncbi:MAG TPA: hypothetical protein VI731_06710 [Bacteroidia bacterium]|nr:hypothetical protein [Bacteroidia bacterium]
MKNTTKLKNILRLYVVSLNMDDDDNFHFSIRDKKNGSTTTFSDRSYSTVIAKAFGHMKKELKFKETVNQKPSRKL